MRPKYNYLAFVEASVLVCASLTKFLTSRERQIILISTHIAAVFRGALCNGEHEQPPQREVAAGTRHRCAAELRLCCTIPKPACPQPGGRPGEGRSSAKPCAAGRGTRGRARVGPSAAGAGRPAHPIGQSVRGGRLRPREPGPLAGRLRLRAREQSIDEGAVFEK